MNSRERKVGRVAFSCLLPMDTANAVFDLAEKLDTSLNKVLQQFCVYAAKCAYIDSTVKHMPALMFHGAAESGAERSEISCVEQSVERPSDAVQAEVPVRDTVKVRGYPSRVDSANIVMQQRFLTPKDCAKAMNVSLTAMYKLLHKADFPKVVKPNGTFEIPTAEFIRWARSHGRLPEPECN